MVATYSGDTGALRHLRLDPDPWRRWAGADRREQRSELPSSVEGRSIDIGRDLKLDARLAVEVKPRDREALVEATGDYVLTKTVVAAYRSGAAGAHLRDRELQHR